MSRDRRDFLKLVMVGGVTLLTSGAGTIARAATASAKRGARSVPAAAAPPAAVQKEIASQKKAMAGVLATVRKYQLPAGSPTAYVFVPLPPRRTRGH
jgi:hypothetical protein